MIILKYNKEKMVNTVIKVENKISYLDCKNVPDSRHYSQFEIVVVEVSKMA